LLPESLLERLRDARHVCVLTGAGVSAESGVPTFREAQQGLWARYDPMELATPEAFQRDPELVWRWYRWRRELVSQAEPNAGHRALAELQDLVPRLTLVTQNVDGLHQRAGSRDAIEFHGNIFALSTVRMPQTFRHARNAAHQPDPASSGSARVLPKRRSTPPLPPPPIATYFFLSARPPSFTRLPGS
jgi:NAD-dependent deacetylase